MQLLAAIYDTARLYQLRHDTLSQQETQIVYQREIVELERLLGHECLANGHVVIQLNNYVGGQDKVIRHIENFARRMNYPCVCIRDNTTISESTRQRFVVSEARELRDQDPEYMAYLEAKRSLKMCFDWLYVQTNGCIFKHESFPATNRIIRKWSKAAAQAPVEPMQS